MRTVSNIVVFYGGFLRAMFGGTISPMDESKLNWRPRLRPLQMTLQDGALVLSDPLGLSPNPVSLSPAAAVVLGLMDGKRTLGEIAEEYSKIVGERVGPAEILTLIEKLDELYLLDSPRFEEAYRKATEDFLRRDSRPYTMAGLSYPADPMALREKVAAARRLDSSGRDLTARGVVIPHIDPRRGWPVYVEGLRAIFRNPADLIVILGVAHSPIRHPVQVLPMALETPLGRLEVADDVVSKLTGSVSYDLVSDPLAFVREHSVEFPAVFVKALFPERRLRVVPLIVSDLGDGPEAIDEAMIKLREILRGREFLPVAAVDLSHVGPKFGDEFLDEDRMLHYDGEFMASFSTGVPESLKALYEEMGNPTRIDAYGATYALMRLIEGEEGESLAYDVSREDETSSAVSFMAGVIR